MGSRDMTQPGAGLAACNQHHLPLRLLRPQPVPSRTRCPVELRGRFGVADGLPDELRGGSASLPEPLWVELVPRRPSGAGTWGPHPKLPPLLSPQHVPRLLAPSESHRSHLPPTAGRVM